MKKHLLTAAILLWATTLMAVDPSNYSGLHNLPVVYTANQGQVLDVNGKQVPDVLAKSSVPGLDFYLTKSGVTYVLKQYEEVIDFAPHPVYFNDKKYKVHYSRVDVDLAGAIINKSGLRFAEEATWKSNYYYSSDGKGQLAVKHFKVMTLKNVYPGIDWVWKSTDDGKLEYDFVVHPGADVSLIKMAYRYADIVPSQNSLLINTRNGALREGELKAHCGATAVAIEYGFNKAENAVSFNPASYDNSKDLVIDPPLALQWSAQYGGNFPDGLRGVATDEGEGLNCQCINDQPHIYLTGYTTSTNFPTQGQYVGAYFDSTYNGATDAVILKLDSFQNLQWSTFFGGAGSDFGNSIAVTPDTHVPSVYVTGQAQSGFPLVSLAGAYNQSIAVAQDAFIAKFDHSLALQWSTFYGGIGNEEGLKVHIDGPSLYVAGYTNSPSGSFNTQQYQNGYLQTAVIGTEAFILKFNQNGQTRWATLYGGSGDDFATSVATDVHHRLVVTGFTTSVDLPVTNTPGSYYHQINNGGNTDGFILAFNDTTIRLSASYYGGSSNDYFNDVTIGHNDDYIFTGRTSSTDFPIDSAIGFAYNQSHLAGGYDAFLVRCDKDREVKWSTYFGGTDLDAGTGVATDNAGRILLTGFTFSNDLPTDSPQFFGAYWQPHRVGVADGFISGFTSVGSMFWSTYKGDSCYQYPNDIAAARLGSMFYVCGEGMYQCGQSIPPHGHQAGGGGGVGATDGFCWGFGGTGSNTDCFELVVTALVVPCANTCNGAATVATTGGTPPFSYAWSDGSTADSATHLCGADNWVQVQDAAGCLVDSTGLFDLLRVTPYSTEAFCGTNRGGTLDATGMGGTPPYTYLWQPLGVPGPFVDDVSSGPYTVIVTDANNCTASHDTIVDWGDTPPGVDIRVIKYPACGENNGILVAITGNVIINFSVVKTWFWNGGTAVTDTLFNVGAGEYSIDEYGCADGQATQVSIGLEDTVALGTTLEKVQDDLSCITDEGVLSVVLLPGYTMNNPLTFHWSNGDSTQTATGLAGGSYAVTITDASGCTATWIAGINGNVPPDVQFSGSNSLNAVCYQDSSGSIIEPIVTGPGYPYSYRWSTGDTTHGLSNVPPGVYTVTVTGTNGCSAAAAAPLVGFPGSVFIDFTAHNVSCNGGTDGSLEVNVLQGIGTPPYSFYWSNNTTANPAPGLSAGTYHVTITAASGENVISCATIQEPPPLEVNIAVGAYDCPNGGIFTSAGTTGGVIPYAYAWSNGAADSTTKQMSSGPFDVTVTDDHLCTAIAGQTLDVPEAFQVTYTAADILCHGDSAAVVFAAAGGYPSYTGTGTFYQHPGTVTYVVADSLGCTYTTDITRTEPNELEFTISATPIQCNGGTAQIAINVTGGTEPYYGDVGFYAEPAGSYSFGVYDSNGCAVSHNLTLIDPSYFNVSYTAGNISCNGDSAQIAITASGGVSPYTGTGNFYEPAGTYNFTVSDSLGCSRQLSISLTQPASLLVDATYAPILCNGDGSQVTVSATGGVPPYTGVGIFTYPAGASDIIVTDNSGCSQTVSLDISEPDALMVTVTPTGILCHGDLSTVEITATGGTMPYTGTGTITNPAGSYSAQVTDSNGCQRSVQYDLTEPAALVVTVETPDTINCYADSVRIFVSATGGISPYTGTGEFYYHQDGSYDMVVTDANGCEASDVGQVNVSEISTKIIATADTVCENGSVMLTATGNFNFTWYPYGFQSSGVSIAHMPVSTTVSVIGISPEGCYVYDTLTIVAESCNTGITGTVAHNGITVFPNPASDKFFVQMEETFTGNCALNLFTSEGRLVASQTIQPGIALIEVNTTNLANGIYMLQLKGDERDYYYKVLLTGK